MSTYSNERQGRFATEHVADQFDLLVENDVEDWYDAVDESTGTKYEVKSTSQELASGATGRFRLWEDQHRSLTSAAAADGQTAWYAFVLLDDANNVADVARRKPSTVTTIVDRDWNRAEHVERNSRQHKVPWYEVIHR